MGLEDDEVGTVLLDIGLEFLGGPAAGEVVGVLAVREEEYLDIHALGEQQVRTAQGGLLASLVAIIDEGDVGGSGG